MNFSSSFFWQVNPKENLPQQICDLCIVQLNVSYNFKRLALKNDFQIRQYMIENGMSLSRDDEDNMGTTTALEIHQIQHNVIRTNRQFRQLQPPPEIRRNSTTSSVSGASTLMINGRESDVNANTNNTFVHPRPMVRPIQIKVEPVDPEEENKDESPITSSPSSSEPASIVTVVSSTSSEKRSTPMIVINGIVNNESFADKVKKPDWYSAPAPLSVKLGRPRKIIDVSEKSKTEKTNHNLRTIKKRTVKLRDMKKVRKVVQEMNKRVSPRQRSNKTVNVEKKKTVYKRNKEPEQKQRGRPRKDPNAPKMSYKKKNSNIKKTS